MANSGASNENQKVSGLEHLAEDVFSSEKREDIWAILIAVVVLIVSLVFPDQLYHFFQKALYFL